MRMEEVEKTDGRKERERDERRSFRTVESVGLALIDPILGTLGSSGQ